MDVKKMIQNMTYEEFIHSFHSAQPEICDKTQENGDCEMMHALQILSGKWRMSVIYELSKQKAYRFGQLKRAIPGITNTMLTTILRELEEYRIVSRKQFNEIPPHVEYSLTQKGKDLFPLFFEMIKWSAKYS
ncbi:DNA-binding HxlR family transcriptional regulator [Lachnospiraceae bacterium PF1-21]|uniref:Helix-turn-helix transcriptional regulator n=1 Tax=Ohessyouella blattaphilus TaxID=2949333 RepID=A0ABT1EH03_9FIRM|nr:helix-turn-helix domain-containing protein [Ohessyouella blattaphilus]MCP1109047.1 helix-turn-helix transcriptional regulator [Ohessyouella blattaphilus]MCR8562441.1 helix-turn-helix transcriptional regulator [Ohessyouella blattaphilus]MDL2250981.1 helix-turn-helix transcriptional regulator [Lachnospiraceae bacterium OttesenSCG-928-J05]